MGEISQVRAVLEEIKHLDHVQEVSLISRGGMYVLGDGPKGVHLETYAAMSGIMVGAAETTAAELKDNLKHVIIKLTDRDLILMGASNRYILCITTDGKDEGSRVSKSAAQIISKVDLNF